MPDDWLTEDPFSDPADPAADEREERRREREERRRKREESKREQEAAATPAPDAPPPTSDVAPRSERQGRSGTPTSDRAPEESHGSARQPEPPPVARTAEEEFWDESPGAADASQQGSRPPGRGRAVLAAIGRHPFLAAGAIAAVALVWFLILLFQPFHGSGTGRVVVTVPKGASVAEVGDLLGENGVISSSTLFQVRVTLAGKRSDLYPGRYVLAHDMSYGEAIDALSSAPAATTTTVTVPEGYSRPQAAHAAREVGLKGSYMKASVHSKYLNPTSYGGSSAKNLEGFLFPDTFELKAGAPAADLVQLQLEDFKRRIKGVNMSYARSKNLTTYDVVTIASMVEREAEVESERPLIAAVIYNRLHDGMPLGIDATTRFATGNYAKPLTESELAINSPYNTRSHTGLPPGPIDSPGLASVEAAAHPAHVPYLYYVVKPGTCGHHSFSTTAAEFEADVARYNQAREAAGGESPETCG